MQDVYPFAPRCILPLSEEIGQTSMAQIMFPPDIHPTGPEGLLHQLSSYHLSDVGGRLSAKSN